MTITVAPMGATACDESRSVQFVCNESAIGSVQIVISCSTLPMLTGNWGREQVPIVIRTAGGEWTRSGRRIRDKEETRKMDFPIPPEPDL